MKKIKSFKLFEGIEDFGRLSPELTDILNTQIKNELEIFYNNLLSCQIYLGMSCWLDDKGWIGAQKYFWKSGIEELEHIFLIEMFLPRFQQLMKFNKNLKM